MSWARDQILGAAEDAAAGLDFYICGTAIHSTLTVHDVKAHFENLVNAVRDLADYLDTGHSDVEDRAALIADREAALRPLVDGVPRFDRCPDCAQLGDNKYCPACTTAGHTRLLNALQEVR